MSRQARCHPGRWPHPDASLIGEYPIRSGGAPDLCAEFDTGSARESRHVRVGPLAIAMAIPIVSNALSLPACQRLGPILPFEVGALMDSIIQTDAH